MPKGRHDIREVTLDELGHCGQRLEPLWVALQNQLVKNVWAAPRYTSWGE
jgi:hypothetical protein